MKNALLLSIILLISFSVFAQSGFEVKGYFGASWARANRKVDLIGSSSVQMENFKEVGVLLSKGIGEKFKLSAGLNYLLGEVKFFPAPNPCINCMTGYLHNPDFQMLSIPIYAEYSLSRLFYVAAGPLVDFQLSEGNNFSDQNGIGYLIGFGSRVSKEKFTFSVFPNYKRHGVIERYPVNPFDNSDKYKHILEELGIQFGLAYRF
ncbi:outer membrane beta-barrel protein [Algoriphagus pacificus]|uniref:Outer membrane beta-barrel protein n=1 Tax=Algoriphagus pacificus TaxID=2811234 RepID=A0ABS3CJ60_9BACT|nr:outer membrane beta-barrel protein [Algoriphagus pacificus]MBN7817133.1 outer membrane beta-barrel protein [Algoriphagus pacificus]